MGVLSTSYFPRLPDLLVEFDWAKVLSEPVGGDVLDGLRLNMAKAKNDGVLEYDGYPFTLTFGGGLVTRKTVLETDTSGVGHFGLAGIVQRSWNSLGRHFLGGVQDDEVILDLAVTGLMAFNEATADISVWPVVNGVSVVPPCLYKEVGVLLWVLVQEYGHEEVTLRELASMYEVNDQNKTQTKHWSFHTNHFVN